MSTCTRLLATLVALALPTLAHADRVWIPLDESDAGTPAEVVFDADRSSDQESWIDIIVHGFWRIDRRDPDHVGYHEIVIPGLASQVSPGVPDLPRAVLSVALPGEVVPQLDVTIETSASLPDYHVWPQWFPDQEYPDGKPAVFAFEESIYESAGLWPARRADVDGDAFRAGGGIHEAQVVVNPIRWDPATGILEVSPLTSVGISHPGSWTPFEPITRERHRLAGATYSNWEGLQSVYPVNHVFYEAHYLIIAPTTHYTVLAPFMAQKKARGFDVEFVSADLVGGSCESVLSAIRGWYASTPANHDHYCLLVGDVEILPTCESPPGALEYAGSVPTDDLFGSVEDDLSKEIFVGRLSVDDRDGTLFQIGKILAYEDQPEVGWHYGRVGLVAHLEEAATKYEWAHEQVRLADYAVEPHFVTLYGSAGTTDADVRNEIDGGGGMGLVAYRGHGSPTAWTGWNLLGEYFDLEDVGALTTPRTPVVWSLSCSNSSLLQEDSIAEAWMSSVTSGGVAHYGATEPSYTIANHVLDWRLFEAVYDRGLTTHAPALAWAEAKMAEAAGSDNAWMYLLLGDPDMQIRRVGLLQETPWLVSTNDIVTCPGGDCSFEVIVRDLSGVPLPDVLVGAWKPLAGALTGDASDVHANRYTDASGVAAIPASPSTEGWLYFTVQDDVGNASFDSVYVSTAVSTPEVGDGPASLRVAPTVMRTHTRLTFGAPLTAEATVIVVNAAGQRIRTLDASPGAREIGWDGRSDQGDRVAPGAYWLVLREEARRQVARVVVVG
jgi:hypothetical protein